MKFWWRGEPIIIGSLRWKVIENDLVQDIKRALADWKKHKQKEQMK